MTNKEFTQIREALSLTKKEFAEKIGATAMMVGRYESGSCRIPDSLAAVVEKLVEPAAPSEEDVASLIKGIRENLELSKSAFARLIGVSATAAGNYESGKNRPKDEILEKIKSLLDEKSVEQAAVKETAKEAAKEAAVEEAAVEEAAVEEAVVEEAAAQDASAENQTQETAPVDEKETAPAEEKSTATSIVIESRMGGTITTDEILSRLPAGCDTVYVKPEENAAYWVKGEKSGVINLW